MVPILGYMIVHHMGRFSLPPIFSTNCVSTPISDDFLSWVLGNEVTGSWHEIYF